MVYIHGGPEGQEGPDFAWFSMPLIQLLTLHGFVVFVPNVRGSSGYGLWYARQVDHDWGGQDRLDHVHAMAVLAEDPGIDTTRAAVMGRSYGGYMALLLATRHADLWSAAVDLFGPVDLPAFLAQTPETQKPYFLRAVGDPEHETAFLIERSPGTYLDELRCPLLVIHGRNDPRVLEAESRSLVERVRALGQRADYLVFDDEGHDIVTAANRARCYDAIVSFLMTHLVTSRTDSRPQGGAGDQSCLGDSSISTQDD